MAWIVLGTVLAVVVALIVISVSSGEEDDWSTRRPGRSDPDEAGLDDLLDD